MYIYILLLLLMCGVKKKQYFNVLMVVIIIYCVGYIILLCYLYYFNVLNVNYKKKKKCVECQNKAFDVGCIIQSGVKIDKLVF